MNEFALLDEKPNTLLLPKKAELFGVKSYFKDMNSAREFEENITQIRKLLNDKSAKIGIAVREMSQTTNNAMVIRSNDKNLIEKINCGEFEVMSGQPSLVARAAKLEQAEEFYKSFFGQEFSVGLPSVHQLDFDKINSETQFIGHLYADELSMRRKLGVYQGVFDALTTAVRAVNGRKSQGFLDKIAQSADQIVGVTAKTESGRQAQFFILPFEKDSLLSAMKGVGHLDLEDFGKIVASVYCDTIYEYRQNLIKGKIYKTVNLFYSRINKVKIYSFNEGRSANRLPDVQIGFPTPKSGFKNKEFIEKASTSTEGEMTLKAKLDAIDAFALQNLGAPVSEKILEMFPELLVSAAREPDLNATESQPTWLERVSGELAPAPGVSNRVPDSPTALWKNDKLAGDTPPDFIKRHYGLWLNADATGLTRPDIKRLDPSLYMALANWLRKNELPDDCPVPIKSQRLDSELARVAEGGLASVVSGDDPAAILKDAQRLLSAKRRRER